MHTTEIKHRFALGAKISPPDKVKYLSHFKATVMAITIDVAGGVAYELSHWNEQNQCFTRNHFVYEREMGDWTEVV